MRNDSVLFIFLLSMMLFNSQILASELNDEIVSRTYVPNHILPQGEVRLICRGTDTLVQSILHTRFINRVKKHIVDAEKKSWGDHPDAAIYIETLNEACSEYIARRKQEDQDVALVISFIDSQENDRVDFIFATPSRSKEGYDIDESETWRSLALSESYIKGNQAYILADAFKTPMGDLLVEAREMCRNRKNAEND